MVTRCSNRGGSVLLSSTIRVANDVDQYAMSFRPSNTEHTIAGRGPFAATVIRIDLHRLLPQRGQISHASVAHGHPTTRRQGIVFGGSPKATASNICLLNIRRTPRQSTSSRAHVPRSPCPGRRRIGPEQPLSTHLRHQARLPECPVPNARRAPLDDLDGRVAAVHWRRGEGPLPSTQPLGTVPLNADLGQVRPRRDTGSIFAALRRSSAGGRLEQLCRRT